MMSLIIGLKQLEIDIRLLVIVTNNVYNKSLAYRGKNKLKIKKIIKGVELRIDKKL